MYNVFGLTYRKFSPSTSPHSPKTQVYPGEFFHGLVLLFYLPTYKVGIIIIPDYYLVNRFKKV